MENSIAMKGGDGPNSYTRNSKHQEVGLINAKVLLTRSIQEKLPIIQTSSDATTTGSGVFCIADLGCSVGPNTFTCVQTIIEGVKLKYKTHGVVESELPEFHVCFNDHVANDFNTLFRSLPTDKNYTAAGVPGSFHGRLFPKASMNFLHSSYALHWLTKVPVETTANISPAWNKGRITCFGSSPDVAKAYVDQFTRDMEAFFGARSVEMACGGLMAILMPCRPEGTLPSESVFMQGFECLGYALADMAKEGLVDETILDSFNLPLFFPTASEVKEVVSNNKHLTTEIMEEIDYPAKLTTHEDAKLWSLHIRAVLESTISKHFGPELNIDELFNRYTLKLEEFSKSPSFTRTDKFGNLFLLVKRS